MDKGSWIAVLAAAGCLLYVLAHLGVALFTGAF